VLLLGKNKNSFLNGFWECGATLEMKEIASVSTSDE
jgi:hypothetical protein